MASAREKGLPIGEGRNEKAVLIGKGSHQSMENVMNVDIGIITVRDDELQAVLQRFRTKRQRIPGRQSYYISHVTAKDGKHYTIAITRCSEQGNDLSQKLAKSMILDLQPQIILVVGIAGGMPSDEFTLGDVIVSSRILNFNVDAQKGGGVTYVTRGSSHALIENITGLLPGERLLLGWNKQDSIGLERPDVDLQQVKIEGGDADWQQKIQKSLDWHFAREQNRRRPPLFKSGHIASSNHLARDPSVVNQWLSMNRAILATEMESAGVCEAANDINYHYPVMAIRGISDIIGLERDGRWTAYACHTAAAFTKAFIKAGIIEPQTNLVDLQQSNTFSEPSSISSVILNQQPVHQTISMQDNSGPPISSAGTPHIISIREQIIHAPLEGAKALSDYLAAHPMKGAQKQTEVDLKRSQLEDIERSYRLLGPEVDKKAEKNRIILSLLQLCLEIEQSE